jgi:hypothetical protein
MVIIEGARLDQIVRNLNVNAAELDACRARLRSIASACDWHSPAAKAFGAELDRVVSQLGSVSTRVTETAAALNGHRQRAENRARGLSSLSHVAVAVARALP